MLISHLMEVLDTPKNQRQSILNYLNTEMEGITAFHVTDASNEQSIRANGLKATECQQGRVTRQAACYLFVSKNEANDTDLHKALGINNPVILRVKLSSEQLLDKANNDNMFNMSFDTYSAIQYLDNINPEAIKPL